jgi:hypothetical protein
MLCMTDSKGRAMWIASHRSEFDKYKPGLRQRREPFRITERTISADGGSVRVVVMTIYPPKSAK